MLRGTTAVPEEDERELPIASTLVKLKLKMRPSPEKKKPLKLRAPVKASVKKHAVLNPPKQKPSPTK